MQNVHKLELLENSVTVSQSDSEIKETVDQVDVTKKFSRKGRLLKPRKVLDL